MSMTLSSFFS